MPGTMRPQVPVPAAGALALTLATGCALVEQGELDPVVGPFAEVDLGADHACARRTDGSVSCWGRDGGGQTEGLFTRIACAEGGFCCGVATDQTVDCWSASASTAQAMATPGGSFTQVATGTAAACALATNGTVNCWGAGLDSVAGWPPDEGHLDVAVGQQGACALDAGGEVRCWGEATDLAEGAPSGRFDALAMSGGEACAWTADAVTCWGAGTGRTVEAEGFTLAGLALGTASGMLCALSVDGVARCLDVAGDWNALDGPDFDDLSVSQGEDATWCAVTELGELTCDGVDPGTGLLDPPTG